MLDNRNVLQEPDLTQDSSGITKIVVEGVKNSVSMIGTINFDFKVSYLSDSDSELAILFNNGKIQVADLESGYGVIMDGIMGTGYAIVTEDYILKRGLMQGISLDSNSEIIGYVSYVDNTGAQREMPLYFVGPGEPSKGIAYDIDGINEVISNFSDSVGQ